MTVRVHNVTTPSFVSFLQTDYEMEVQGEFIHIIRTTETIQIRFNSKSNPAVPFNSKDIYVGPFERIYITTAVAADFQLFISSDPNVKLQSNEITIDTINSVKATATAAHNVVALAAGVATLIKAANLTRKSIGFISDTNDFYFGTSNAVTAANGMLAKGQVLQGFDCYYGDLWGISTLGCNVHYFEEG